VCGPNQIRKEETSHTGTLAGKAQAVAVHLASRQVMRVPWKLFRQAHDQYVQWEAFVLWVKAVVNAEGCASLEVAADINRRSPGFLEEAAPFKPPELLALRLHEWIHDRIFVHSKQEGWLDALHFFGVRDPRCEGAWALWETCEQQWKANRPRVYPPFEIWWREAQDRKLFQEVSASRVVDVVEAYVDWMAFAHWLRPFIGADDKLPSQVARELRRRCADFVTSSMNERPKGQHWQGLITYIEERFFSKVKTEGWLDYVQQKACHHPRHVRTIAYSEHWMKTYSRSPVLPYPHFSRWRYAADNFVERSAA
jgi:hypothetical protein